MSYTSEMNRLENELLPKLHQTKDCCHNLALSIFKHMFLQLIHQR